MWVLRRLLWLHIENKLEGTEVEAPIPTHSCTKHTQKEFKKMSTVAINMGPQIFLDYIYLLIQKHLLYCAKQRGYKINKHSTWPQSA